MHGSASGGCAAKIANTALRRATDVRRAASLLGRRLARSAALVGLVLLSVAPHGGRAQETDPNLSVADARSASRILIVDVERIYRESRAGQSIREAEAALNEQTEDELNARRSALRAESDALTQRRETMAEEEFRQREAAFRRDVADLRRFRRERAREIRRAAAEARTELRQAVEPILVALMRDWRAEVMIDARAVILRASALDITDEAILRLDEQTPSIELRIDQTSNE